MCLVLQEKVRVPSSPRSGNIHFDWLELQTKGHTRITHVLSYGLYGPTEALGDAPISLIMVCYPGCLWSNRRTMTEFS